MAFRFETGALFALALLAPTAMAEESGRAGRAAIGIDFTRSISDEGPYGPLSNFTNFRLALDGERNRGEVEAGYYFRSSNRIAGDGTNAEESEQSNHYARIAVGLYYRTRGEAFRAYIGPKFLYQKSFSKQVQGSIRDANDLDILGGGVVWGLERELVERLSLAGELQGIYARGVLDTESLGTYEETVQIVSTSASLVFRWHFR